MIRLPIEAQTAELVPDLFCRIHRIPMFRVRVLWLDDDGSREIGAVVICRACDDG